MTLLFLVLAKASGADGDYSPAQDLVITWLNKITWRACVLGV